MKLLVHSQTSTVRPLKFGNGWVISSHTLWGCDCLAMMRLKLILTNKKGAPVYIDLTALAVDDDITVRCMSLPRRPPATFVDNDGCWYRDAKWVSDLQQPPWQLRLQCHIKHIKQHTYYITTIKETMYTEIGVGKPPVSLICSTFLPP